MKLALPFAEVISLATAEQPLPEMIRSLDARGEKLFAEIDLNAIPTRSTAMRIAAAVAGTVSVTARFDGFSDGVARFAVNAHALGLPVHKLLPLLLDPVNTAIRDRGLPDGLVEIQRGDSDPLVVIDVQKAVETKVSGMTVTAFRLLDSVFHLEADVGAFRWHG